VFCVEVDGRDSGFMRSNGDRRRCRGGRVPEIEVISTNLQSRRGKSSARQALVDRGGVRGPRTGEDAGGGGFDERLKVNAR